MRNTLDGTTELLGDPRLRSEILSRASELPIGRGDPPTRRRVGLSDVLWVAAAFVFWLVLLLWLPFVTRATLTRFTAGALRLALLEGSLIGVALLLAVRFAGAPRAVWIGVAFPAVLAVAMLPLLYFAPGSVIRSVGLGWYVNGVLLPSAASGVSAFLGSSLPRRTPEWSSDD